MAGPPTFGTVTREAVPQQIVSRLLDLIQQRHLGPGDRLPAERELAASMGVSRSSLREALRALTVLGVTEMRHGTGTYVSSLEPDLLVRHLSFVLSLSDHASDQLFEARRVVEPAMAALAAERAEPAALAPLDEQIAAMETALEDFAAYRQADVRWHVGLAEAAGSPRLIRAMTEAQGLMSDLIALIAHPPELLAWTNQQHAGMLAAVRGRDAERATRIMLEHLKGTEHVLAALLPPA